MKRLRCSCGSINTLPARYLLRDPVSGNSIFQVFRACIDCGMIGQNHYFCVLCSDEMLAQVTPTAVDARCSRCGVHVRVGKPIKKQIPETLLDAGLMGNVR